MDTSAVRARGGWRGWSPWLLLVVHRGVIAVALAELLGLSGAERRALGIDLASIHVLTRDRTGWQPERLNAVDHLAAVAVTP